MRANPASMTELTRIAKPARLGYAVSDGRTWDRTTHPHTASTTDRLEWDRRLGHLKKLEDSRLCHAGLAFNLYEGRLSPSNLGELGDQRAERCEFLCDSLRKVDQALSRDKPS
jgi:hypothetical protein